MRARGPCGVGSCLGVQFGGAGVAFAPVAIVTFPPVFFVGCAGGVSFLGGTGAAFAPVAGCFPLSFLVGGGVVEDAALGRSVEVDASRSAWLCRGWFVWVELVPGFCEGPLVRP